MNAILNIDRLRDELFEIYGAHLEDGAPTVITLDDLPLIVTLYDADRLFRVDLPLLTDCQTGPNGNVLNQAAQLNGSAQMVAAKMFYSLGTNHLLFLSSLLYLPEAECLDAINKRLYAIYQSAKTAKEYLIEHVNASATQTAFKPARSPGQATLRG
ncbi:MAG: hypothetical protein RSG77_27275 [Hafnia sp.]